MYPYNMNRYASYQWVPVLLFPIPSNENKRKNPLLITHNSPPKKEVNYNDLFTSDLNDIIENYTSENKISSSLKVIDILKNLVEKPFKPQTPEEESYIYLPNVEMCHKLKWGIDITLDSLKKLNENSVIKKLQVESLMKSKEELKKMIVQANETILELVNKPKKYIEHGSLLPLISESSSLTGSYLIVFSTCPDQEIVAKKIAKIIGEDRWKDFLTKCLTSSARRNYFKHVFGFKYKSAVRETINSIRESEWNSIEEVTCDDPEKYLGNKENFIYCKKNVNENAKNSKDTW